ncbi:hypothetical protein FRZ06_06620 [Anoxybacterium hadale]|uniref:Uncharacterized protein n=1 Tax=Anoxybacterium hadale TaxID=3408580 RepID=A0ACD1A9S9_9FIRM|nr:hypothetical protein FRZ06_06620 [Clostridiales bacterium]
MKNLTTREKYLIILLGITFLLFLYTKMFLLPVLEKISLSSQAIAEDRIQVAELTAMKTTNETLRESLETLKKEHEEALFQLPEHPRNPEVAYSLKPLADISGVTLLSVSLGDGVQISSKEQKAQVEEEAPEQKESGNDGSASEEQKNALIFSMPVTIEGEAGSYGDIMKFADQLEKEKRFTKIKSLNIDAQEETRRSGSIVGQKLKVNISVDYYYTNSSSEKPSYYFNNGSYGKDDLFR